MRVSSSRSFSRTTSVSDVVGVRSKQRCADAHLERRIHQQHSLRVTHCQAAGRIDGHRRFAHAALIADEGDDRAHAARFPNGRSLDAAEQFGQFAAGDGPPQEVLHAGANGLDENRAFRHLGLKTVRPKDRRHGGLGRDDRRFFGKGLQRPDIGPHFHQRDLRTATAGRLDRLADVVRVVNHRVQFVQRGKCALQLGAEPRIGTHHQDVDCRRHEGASM